MQRVHVILNGRSGVGGATPELLQELFRANDAMATVTRLNRRVDLPALIAGLPPATCVVAAGGDGTVSAVAAAIVSGPGPLRERRMGVLPVGTLNHFARDLHLPLALEAAVAIAAGTCTRRVDVARVNTRYFVNNASLGAYPRMVVDRERMKKGGGNKWAALVLASLRAFVRFKRLDVTMELGHTARRCRIPFLFVGNNEYCVDGRGADGLDASRLGTRAALDRGLLGLSLAPGATRLDILRMAFGALTGNIRQDPAYESFVLPGFRVDAPTRKLRIALDGEVCHLRTPLVFSSLPAALNVLVEAAR